MSSSNGLSKPNHIIFKAVKIFLKILRNLNYFTNWASGKPVHMQYLIWTMTQEKKPFRLPLIVGNHSHNRSIHGAQFTVSNIYLSSLLKYSIKKETSSGSICVGCCGIRDISSIVVELHRPFSVYLMCATLAVVRVFCQTQTAKITRLCLIFWSQFC